MSVKAALMKFEKKTEKLMDFEHSPGLLGEGVAVAEKYATGLALGFVHGKYRDKADLLGGRIPMTLAVGVLGKGLAMLSCAFMGGKGASHLSNIGDAGLVSHAFAKGVDWGFTSSGRKVHVFEKNEVVPAGLATTTVIGEIPQAPPGINLTAEEIAHFSRQR